MSNQDDLSDSLLRRSLQDRDAPRSSDDIPPSESRPASPMPGSSGPARPTGSQAGSPRPISPIRPTFHDESEPQEPLTPSLPDKTPAPPLTPREQMQQAEEALINLRQKMARVAAEFAQGQLNRAQFDAIYGRYSEQRDITERLLARDPQSQAWQSVVQAGHTTFLKQHYEARVLAYAIYDQGTGDLVAAAGPLKLSSAQVGAVLARLQAIRQQRSDLGPALKKINDGRCVLFMPGELALTVAIFSLEPSAMQISRVKDIHVDFERANRYALEHRDYALERMVFPHRALLEEKRY
ncbi:MAG: hypothetical protein JW910_12785 [Anaerolineae bacterium]|nr:hypothetical protein [Anaerolineae bacterium]